MDLQTSITAAFLSLLPISELRGAIPFVMAHGWSWWVSWLYCVGFNALVSPLAFLFLATFHKLFLTWNWYRALFERVVESTRKKVHDKIERYGYWGVTLFVAVPLPITGAWTGTLGGWLFGLDRKKTILACLVGVSISGTIVTLVVTLGISALSIFTKHI